jgi:predicted nucleotidyltransferase
MTAGALEALAERLRDLRESVPDLELLVLFGSAATGRARPSSDLDLAVSSEGPADLDALYVALAPRFRTDRLDLVDLRRVGPLLAFQIARAGLVLFERSAGLFRQFQSLASRRYADTRSRLREAQRRAIQVFLHQEGLT